MDKPDIDFTYESVTFVGCDGAGNMVFRPKTMSVSSWTKFWDSVKSMGDIDHSKMREELMEAKEEIKGLEDAIKDLEGEIKYLREMAHNLENEP